MPKNHVLVLAAVAVLVAVSGWVAGQSQPTSARSAASASSPAASNAASRPVATLDDALILWMSQDKAGAAKTFLAVDWQHPTFAKGSMFAMKESQFAALPKFDRERLEPDIRRRMQELRELLTYLRDTGRTAAANGKPEEARKCFQQMAACGEFFLNDADSLATAKVLAKAFVRVASEEMAKLRPGQLAPGPADF